jgi:Photosynthesis system II assembly factor YCF48
MPTEDRDRLFEKALARHLRGAADGSDSACPDAETLAAYHEGALSVDEMSAAKKHFVSCARCQEILEQLAATQSVSELRNQEDELVTGGAVSRPKNGEVHGAASAPSVATCAPKETESRVAHFPTKKKWLLGWAAPAGAIAAGLLLYVSLRDFRSPAKHAEPATQIAENRADNSNPRDSYAVPGVPQKAPQTPPLAAPKQKHDELAATLSRQQAAKPAPSVLLDELESLRSKAQPPKDSKAEKKLPEPLGPAPKTAANANTPQSGGRISRVEQGTNPAKTRSFDAAGKSGLIGGSLQNGADAQQSQIQLQASGAATGAPAASPSSPVPPPPVPPASASQQVTVTAAAPEVANETVAVSALNKKEANLPAISRNMLDPAMLPPGMVVASNKKSIWRFGERGAIAHSSDGGKTWEAQEVPVTATLTSGSAPAKNICWIAGAAGTLLRTTDGGKHWQLIIAPIAGDLGGVMASDGKHATIWDVPRQATYQTSNGGKTWEKKTAE